MVRWILGACVGLGLSCTGSSVFVCAGDEDCGAGRCEANGYCSFPDDDCAGGWAYGELSAPQLAGQCVDQSGSTGPDPSGGEADTGRPSTDDAADSTGGVDPGTTTSPMTSTTATTDEPPPDTGEPPSDTGEVCPVEEEVILWAEDATLVAPMQLEVADLPTDPLYAFSEEAGVGQVHWRSTLMCSNTFYAWGLVRDQNPGPNRLGDPDSFYISLDGSPELLWEYGCAFEDGSPPWRWVPINPLDSCDAGPMDLPLDAGEHDLTLINAEDAVLMSTAGIVAVFISTDPGADPNDVLPTSP